MSGMEFQKSETTENKPIEKSDTSNQETDSISDSTGGDGGNSGARCKHWLEPKSLPERQYDESSAAEYESYSTERDNASEQFREDFSNAASDGGEANSGYEGGNVDLSQASFSERHINDYMLTNMFPEPNLKMLLMSERNSIKLPKIKQYAT